MFNNRIKLATTTINSALKSKYEKLKLSKYIIILLVLVIEYA